MSNPQEFCLPTYIEKVRPPPIKCQGIKTRLVNFIAQNLRWDGKGVWHEPFMGSGVVALNLLPRDVSLSDSNPHIIAFFQAVQSEEITPQNMREFLAYHGQKLRQTGEGTDSYYYEMRDRFNETGDPFYFLFLNRSCFNGLMRFNRMGEFNVPFCRKPSRFSKGYITKIVNQIHWAQEAIHSRNFQFSIRPWEEAVASASGGDFVYLDPPYFGRHVDYYGQWGEAQQAKLVQWMRETPAGFALSLWSANKHRKNAVIAEKLSQYQVRTHIHYYFVGAVEENRSKMEEALIIQNGFATEKAPVLGGPFKDYHG